MHADERQGAYVDYDQFTTCTVEYTMVPEGLLKESQLRTFPEYLVGTMPPTGKDGGKAKGAPLVPQAGAVVFCTHLRPRVLTCSVGSTAIIVGSFRTVA